jgi:hypothetical protein
VLVYYKRVLRVDPRPTKCVPAGHLTPMMTELQDMRIVHQRHSLITALSARDQARAIFPGALSFARQSHWLLHFQSFNPRVAIK